MNNLITYLFLLSVVFSQNVQAQLSLENAKSLTSQFKRDGDPHAISLAMHIVEMDIRRSDEKTKLAGIQQALDFASAIYETRDLNVSLDKIIGRLPDFDATKYGSKPLFAGTDPRSIKDPILREAYEKALADHEVLLGKVVAEKYKMQEGDYCAEVAARTLLTSDDQAVLSSQVKEYITSMPAAPWIKKHLFDIVFPQASAEPVQQ